MFEPLVRFELTNACLQNKCCTIEPQRLLAQATGVEPITHGFGDRLARQCEPAYEGKENYDIST